MEQQPETWAGTSSRDTTSPGYTPALKTFIFSYLLSPPRCLCVYIYVQKEQDREDKTPYLLPRKTFGKVEFEQTQYLRDIVGSAHANNATVQVSSFV